MMLSRSVVNLGLAVAWSAVVVAVHVGIQSRRVECVGYGYFHVVKRGEWWRLAVAPACHRERHHCLLAVVGVLYVAGSQPDFAVASLLTVACVELIAVAVAAALAAVFDDYASDRWLAHGSSVLVLAWIARGPIEHQDQGLVGGKNADTFVDDAPRPSILALLFLFAFQLVAPEEPPLPMLVACVVGFVVSRVKALHEISLYWSLAAAFWFVFLSSASFKATRPHANVPLLTYSNLPLILDDDDDEGRHHHHQHQRHDDDDETRRDDDDDVAPDGAPVFRIAHRDRRPRQRPADQASTTLRNVLARQGVLLNDLDDDQPTTRQSPSASTQGGNPFFVQDLEADEYMLRRHLLRGNPDDFPLSNADEDDSPYY